MEGISLTIQDKELLSNNAQIQQKKSDDTSVSQSIAKQDEVAISDEAREKLEADIQQSHLSEQKLDSDDMLRHALSTEGANEKNIPSSIINIKFFADTTSEQQEATLEALQDQLTPKSYSLAELLEKYKKTDSSMTEFLASSTKSYDEMLLDQLQKNETQEANDGSEKSLNKNLQFQFNAKINTYI